MLLGDWPFRDLDSQYESLSGIPRTEVVAHVLVLHDLEYRQLCVSNVTACFGCIGVGFLEIGRRDR